MQAQLDDLDAMWSAVNANKPQAASRNGVSLGCLAGAEALMLHGFVGNIAPSPYGIHLAASNSFVAEARLATTVLSCISSLMQQCTCSANQRQSLFANHTKAA